MRERIAKGFAVGVALLVTVLAGVFAERQNLIRAPGAASDSVPASAFIPPPAVPPAPEALTRGRAVFEEQGCTRCHRLEAVGNPRSPLDGVGARLAPDRIRAFVVADSGAESALTRSVVRAKELYRDVPEGDLDALVVFLGASRNGS